MYTHLSGAGQCLLSARAVVVLTVWYRLVSHKILLPCFSLTRKNVALTFWQNQNLPSSRPNSNRKGKESRKKATKTVKRHNITPEFVCPASVWREKNVALTFWQNQNLPSSRPNSNRKRPKIPGKGHNITTELYGPASVWREKMLL